MPPGHPMLTRAPEATPVPNRASSQAYPRNGTAVNAVDFWTAMAMTAANWVLERGFKHATKTNYDF